MKRLAAAALVLSCSSSPEQCPMYMPGSYGESAQRALRSSGICDPEPLPVRHEVVK
jgi:hypothetical protein